jgi:predicted PurR-regulated permease PerM
VKKTIFDITWASLFRILAVLLLAVTVYYVREVFVILFVAIIISSALYRPVKYLEERRVPRVLSVLMIFLIAFAIIALILYAVVPVLIIQLKYFLAHINDLRIPFLDSFGASNTAVQLNERLNEWLNNLFYGGSDVLGFLMSFAGNALLAFVTVVLSFYLSISKGGIKRFIRAVMPTEKEAYAIDLYERTRRKIGRWFTSQIIVSFFVGSLTFISLLILGTEYALLLGILAAVLEIVPYVGPIAIGIISFVVILPQSASLAFLAVIIFFLIQQLENHVLVPLIIGRAIGVDPVVVVLAILAGGELGGLVGAVIAVPVAIVLQELIDDWGARKTKSSVPTPTSYK